MRLSKSLDTKSKMAIYNTFILSNFSYCPLVWACCGKTNIQRLEKLQRRALRFVFNDFESDHEQLLLKAGRHTLLIDRIRTLAIEVFKCVHNISPNYMCNMFKRQITPYELRDSNKLQLPKFRTITYGFKTFSYIGAKLWNILPPHIKGATDVHEFKTLLRTWDNIHQCTDWF